MLRFPLRTVFLALASLPLLVACATGSDTSTFGGGGTGTTGTGGATTTSGNGGGITIGTGGSGGAAPLSFYAYAHTGSTLYEVDPNAPTAQPKVIGTFDCNSDGSMMDLAVNKNGQMWGITATKAYQLTVQGNTVHCGTPIQLGDGQVKFYALTFAPEGVIGASETLIAGNTAGELWAIDTTNGNLTPHGTFGNVPQTDGNGHDYPSDPQTTGTDPAKSTVGKPWQLSGDIAFLSNNGKPLGFATVRDCTSTTCSKVDTLIQIDMVKLQSVGSQSVTSSVRGQILNKGCGGAATAYQQLLGIAAWNDKVYGFSHNGAVIEVDNSDGSACMKVDTPMLYWNGAAVTTSAPVIIPK